MLLHQKNSLLCHFGLPPIHPAHHPGGERIRMFSFPLLLQHCPRLLKSYYHSCTGSPFSATLWTDPIGFISFAPSVMLPAASHRLTRARVADSISSNTDIPLSNPICDYDATGAVMFHQSRSRKCLNWGRRLQLRI